MFLKHNHQKLYGYHVSRGFVFECYKLTKSLPSDEKFGMICQIRRTAFSVHQNIAEGSSGRSAEERKRYYEIERGSIIEIDAVLDIALDLSYLQNINTEVLGENMINSNDEL